MTADDRHQGAVDLGCGSGEILSELCRLVKINIAIDFSESMLKTARKTVDDKRLVFQCQDVFAHIAESRDPIWISSQAINQYSNRDMLHVLIRQFLMNEHARSMYLFDTIEPIKYLMARRGVLGSYNSCQETSYIGRILALAQAAAVAIVYPTWFEVGYLGRIIGYGVSPTFWWRVGESHCLNIRIASSRYYEYRYHVAIEKNSERGVVKRDSDQHSPT